MKALEDLHPTGLYFVFAYPSLQAILPDRVPEK